MYVTVKNLISPYSDNLSATYRGQIAVSKIFDFFYNTCFSKDFAAWLVESGLCKVLQSYSVQSQQLLAQVCRLTSNWILIKVPVVF